MKYFEVYMAEATPLTTTRVYSDGSAIPETEDTIGNMLVEYIVYEYDEDGTQIDEKSYKIGGFFADEYEALEQIKEDHPATEWQNHDW